MSVLPCNCKMDACQKEEGGKQDGWMKEQGGVEEEQDLRVGLSWL